ncbi:MAG: phosphoglycerate kinase, partial [Clostridia bacterium]|nr:phosphoglycerate kinase [Clostridia bacterium]
MKRTVDDINVSGKKVLVRCDFNVPLNKETGEITDATRIVESLPTIKKLINDGGRIILCSHLGKAKGTPDPKLTLKPVAEKLSELLGKEVKFADDDNVVGENARRIADELQDGDVMLLQNTRYRAGEEACEDEFSSELASLAEVFVNDAFGTAHRAHASNVGVTKYIKDPVVGYLMEKEVKFLGDAVDNP